MDIDADAGNEKEDPNDGDDLRHMRLMAAVPPKEGPSDDVKADEDDGDQQVDQDHRPKRIQERTVGIQQWREQLRRLPEPSPIQEQTADEERLDNPGHDSIRNLGPHRQQEQRTGQEQENRQPEMIHIVAFRLGHGLRRHLEQGRTVHDDGYADAARQGPYRIAVRQMKMRVHTIEGAGFQLIDNLKSHNDRQRAGLLHPGQVPLWTVIDISQCR